MKDLTRGSIIGNILAMAAPMAAGMIFQTLYLMVDLLRIISRNFVAQGIVFTCSGMFQGLGNTRPSMLSSRFRLLVFVPIVIYLTYQPGFVINQVMYVSVLSVTLQAIASFLLLQKQFQLKVNGLKPGPETSEPETTSKVMAEAE